MKKGLAIGFFILLVLFPFLTQPAQAHDDDMEDFTLIEKALVLRETYVQLTEDMFKITSEIFGFIDADKKEIEQNAELNKHMEELKNVILQNRVNSKKIREDLESKSYSSITDDQLCDEITFLELQISYQYPTKIKCLNY